jgi:mono/diheme cytochrome c family protein
MHLVAAIGAGWLLDRGRASRVLAVAAGFLVVACLLLRAGAPSAWVPVFYTAGVSLYSTALVYYPACGARPNLAAICFAVAGWFGSALGIGMAQDLSRVPIWFLGIAAGVILLALAARARWVAAGLVAVGVAASTGHAEGGDAQARLGREVYVAEGCMHCHSQFVRPGMAADVERWGPARSLSATITEEPPLFGNRRQGPDLAQVGNRRSPEWQRLHLKNPQAMHPGSRMPAYAYLFRGEEGRGEALVAYLASLGEESLVERIAVAARWQPSVRGGVGVGADEGARLFSMWCAACHGAEGRSDGALAGQLSVRPPDWTREPWRHVRADEPRVETALARIIKFGLLGTPMAGHEYFTDGEAVALARYVARLYERRTGNP